MLQILEYIFFKKHTHTHKYNILFHITMNTEYESDLIGASNYFSSSYNLSSQNSFIKDEIVESFNTEGSKMSYCEYTNQYRTFSLHNDSLMNEPLFKAAHFSCTSLLRRSKKIQKERVTTPDSRISQDSKKTKGPWTTEEDAQLLQLYNKHGPKWAKISSIMKARDRKQIRDRYNNYVNPNINHSEWTEEEEFLFEIYQKKFGNKWCEIAKRMPGRSENQVKSYSQRLKNTGRRKSQKKKFSKNEEAHQVDDMDINFWSSDEVCSYFQLLKFDA